MLYPDNVGSAVTALKIRPTETAANVLLLAPVRRCGLLSGPGMDGIVIESLRVRRSVGRREEAPAADKALPFNRRPSNAAYPSLSRFVGSPSIAVRGP